MVGLNDSLLFKHSEYNTICYSRCPPNRRYVNRQALSPTKSTDQSGEEFAGESLGVIFRLNGYDEGAGQRLRQLISADRVVFE